MLHIYLDTENGKTIGIRNKRKPVRRKQMYVVYEYDSKLKKYGMACFPEIKNSLLFSDRFIYLGKLQNMIY